MNNIGLDGQITIEQFAAFLDGNLSAEGMQEVNKAIEAHQELSNLLSEVIDVDESEELMMSHSEDLQQEILSMEVELPLIPVAVETDDDSALTAMTEASNGLEEGCLEMESDLTDGGFHSMESPQQESSFVQPDDLDFGNSPEDTIGINDFTL